VKTHEAERQDLADLGEALVGGHRLWLQRVPNRSSWRRRNMIALDRAENSNLLTSEAARRRK
jgi:hypothetical protein